MDDTTEDTMLVKNLKTQIDPKDYKKELRCIQLRTLMHLKKSGYFMQASISERDELNDAILDLGRAIISDVKK